MEYVLDDIDYRMIEILQMDGRITMRKLAKEIGMSSPATTERLRRLEQAGVITGYQACLSPMRMGFKTSALFFIDLLPDKQETLEELLSVCQEAVACIYSKANENFIVVQVLCRDAYHLTELQKDFFEVGYCTVTVIEQDTVRSMHVQPRMGVHQDHIPLRKRLQMKKGL